ncbi:MAG: NADH-quinone oxidoreductase subunit NuoG [Armatimonadota bacterium]|nr:NADH-quinone oxidoreductase subunit NuoG [Armatimonadota bacterium]MDR7533184.1 NADH-quinone oxidoreductase subunit NuoG [Armatimonadota bacterium]MDR7535428.1 NADH-quinone oxidoreductase subunit NuoG [Armatimonadota bacterium]
MATSPPEVVTLTIDGRTVTVPKGTTVYHAARAAGSEIPIFCYHDRMPPLGACRMCLVKVEKMPKLQTACTLPAAEGMVVDTQSAEVRAGQEAILEFLLINHPLDCPICDKGGECPLQDQTLRFGPGRSRFVEAKRDFAKPVALGPVLMLDRERCILCWRCVRFGEIVAGDHALKGFARGFTSEINTPLALPVDSRFIGNTIAICPVGALTSRTYRFRARPWDSRPVASTCTLCGLGCAVWLDVRDGQVVRTRARESAAINDIWLCDLGFFGHDYVASPDRLRVPLIRRHGRLEEATWAEALDLVGARLATARARGPQRVAFLGGRRLANEDIVLAATLFRDVVGTPHLDHRTDVPAGSPSLEVAWGLRAPIEEIGRGDVFVLIGCDLTEEYPVLWLRLKQALDRGARLILLHVRRPEVARWAHWTIVRPYDRLAQAVMDLRAATSAAKDGRPPGPATGQDHDGAAPALVGAGGAVAAGGQVHVFVGRVALDGPPGRSILRAAADLAARVGGLVHVMRGRGNDIGAQRLGLLPGEGGWTAPQILQRAAAGEVDVLYVAGADPATDAADATAWPAARAGAGFVVVHEAFLSPTAESADVVLPALVLPEKDGTVMNLEGRLLPLRAAVAGPGQARADAEIFMRLADRLGATLAPGTADELLALMRRRLPGLALEAASPVGPVRVPVALPAAPETAAAAGSDGDRLTVLPVDALFTRGTMTARCPGVAELAGPPQCVVHPDDAARLEIADGALVQVATAAGAVVLQARVSDETPAGQVLVPRRAEGLPIHHLVRWPEIVARATVRALVPAAIPGGDA